MANPTIQLLGITRWSYPGTPDGFRKSSEDLDELRAKLYAPERLNHRLFLLEHLILPSLRQQTDPEFKQLFVMGDQLPDPWRNRLVTLLATLPQAVPVFAPEGQNMRQMFTEMIPEYRNANADVLAQYRIDDDDTVAVDFVQETRRIFKDLNPFYSSDGIAGLDFTRGFIMETSQEGVEFRPVSARHWAPGLVVFQAAETAQSLFEYPHLRIWHSMPTLTHRETPMYIRGAHHDNDSHLDSFARRTKSFRFNPRNKRRFFQRRFAIDSWDIHEKWQSSYSSYLGQQIEKRQVRQSEAG
ncbi:MAG: hypothetical protein HKP51_01565 [Sulfitobacter sp.]|nr:hypothetical protein [Sulfitobacter sp.]